MDQTERQILDAMESTGPIPRRRVRSWIKNATQIETDALLYEFTRDHWHRIEPRLARSETCALIERYLLGCIRENPSGGRALGRYDAAGELERWFDHLAGAEDDILPRVVDAVTTLFLTSDNNVRLAIEHGFLEHVLEQTAMRPLFAHWANDDRLQGAWQNALAWGKAHPNFVKNLRAVLRDVSESE